MLFTLHFLINFVIQELKFSKYFSESFLLSLKIDQHPEDEIFCSNNKNGFTKCINRLNNKPDVRIV